MLKLFLIGVALSIVTAQRRGYQSYPDYDSDYNNRQSSHPSSNQGSYRPYQGSYPSSNQRSYPSDQGAYPTNPDSDLPYSKNSYSNSPKGSYPERSSYPSYPQGPTSYPKTKPTGNEFPKHGYAPYSPPLKVDTYVSPVSHSHSISPPYTDPYSKGGPTYSSHTSQTFLASVHP